MPVRVTDTGSAVGGAALGLAGLLANQVGQRRGLSAMRGVTDDQSAVNAGINARSDALVDQHLSTAPVSVAGAQGLFQATDPGPFAGAGAAGGDLSSTQQAALRVGLRDDARSEQATARRDAVLQAIRQSLARHGLSTSALGQRLQMLEDERALRQSAFDEQLQAASMQGQNLRQMGQVGLSVAPGLLRRGLSITPSAGGGTPLGPNVSPAQAEMAPRQLTFAGYQRAVGG